MAWLAAVTATVQASVVPIRNAKDVVNQWTADQHLYVKGDVGVSRTQLDRLEEWLDENGPHWTVVLLQNAAGESYQAADGRRYQGMEAVEYALGHGLSNRTGFGELVAAETGESDGCVFVLFLEERKFSYFGSDAQDRRGLGESRWVGELDRNAFRAMRGGGRVADAVKDTVTLINSRLQETISREEQTRQQKQRELERAITESQIRLSALEQDVGQVREHRGVLLSRFSDASGELSKPPVDDWLAEINEIRQQLNEETVYALSQKVTSVGDRIAEYLNAYAEAETFETHVAKLEQRFNSLRSAPNNVAESMIAEAQQLIQDATVARAAGRFEFQKCLAKATRVLDEADAAVIAEQERLQRADARRALIRNTAIGTGILILGGLAGLAVVLNRRRKPARQLAYEAFAERKKSVDKEVQRVFDLFEHSGEILGSRKRIEERGYEGRTKELGHQTFDNVDDLIVMSKEVERVMSEADELIHPKGPVGRIINALSGSRYARGLGRITGKPLKFDRDQGLPLALDEAAAPQPAVQDGTEPPQFIEMTFDEVFERFRDRCERANVTIEQIESSFLSVNDGLEELQSQIDAAQDLEEQLALGRRPEPLFRGP